MSFSISQDVELNESKFLSEQITWQEQPTEQQILQKAQELEIDDLVLARQSLLKQLQPEWRPYINRHGKVYYINFQQKKGYVDHPIDMEFKITYAIKNNKKVPNFKVFSIEQISENPKTILKEISAFQNSKGLKIVYEESDQQSMKRHTLRSQQDEQNEEMIHSLNSYYEEEIQRYKKGLEKQMKKQLSEYGKFREQEYNKQIIKYQNQIKELKQDRIRELVSVCERQWDEKNKINFEKAVESTRDELDSKRIKYEDMLNRSLQLNYEIHSFKDKELNYKLLSRAKIVNRKQKQKDICIGLIRSKFKKRVLDQIYKAQKGYQEGVKVLTSGHLNYQNMFDRNLQEIIEKNNQKKIKKRYSIFNSQVFEDKKVEQKMKQISVNLCQTIWSQQMKLFDSFVPEGKRSLPLRLMKRIL